MLQQAEDFRAESNALYALLLSLNETEFNTETGFKGWTFNSILRHLHVWNHAADLSLQDEAAFKDFFSQVGKSIAGGLRGFEEHYLDSLSGKALLETYHARYNEVADHFAGADPSARVVWAGPSMSVRSSITARLMETWAHAQAIYDALGVDRTNGDHIQGIVVLGVNTYGWTFKNRRETPPDPMPHLVLTAPSGAIWTYGEESADERIEGHAHEFCQVVTQCRNIADTSLKVTGPNAAEWMAKAQCFAGGPEDPPAPGVRRKAPAPAG